VGRYGGRYEVPGGGITVAGEVHGGAEDAELVRRVTDRDELALAELYRRHAAGAFTVAVRILRHADQAEDVVQDLFVRLWDHPSQFDPQRGSLRSYLLLQARTRSLDVLRAEGARRRREQADGVVDLTDPDGNPEHETLTEAAVGEVRAAISVLTPSEREAIELAFFGGLTYREVAEVLGAPEGTVKSRIRLGLQRMRRTLSAMGG
jgi:RNA polymerase sigma-70 factor, ECF subfamily